MQIALPVVAGDRKADSKSRIRWRRALLATTAALSLGAQNAAWATCSDGATLPSDGCVVGRDKQVLTAANWSPNVFTAAAGSVSIPDNSVHDHNNQAEPLTGGGHNWVFDQGSTLCKVTDIGPADPKTGMAMGWNIPPNTAIPRFPAPGPDRRLDGQRYAQIRRAGPLSLFSSLHVGH
jgi:hypothetical protein